MHNEGIFSSDFGAHIVGKDGLPTQVHLDRHEFYHGYLYGEGIHAHMHIILYVFECSESRKVARDVCMCWVGGGGWGGGLSL